MLCFKQPTKNIQERKYSRMASITQDMRYRLSLIRFAEKHGVSNAARKYKTNRQYIYRWKNRFDGSWDSLRDRSRRPHHHPNQHTPDEIKLIQDMRKRTAGARFFAFLFAAGSVCSFGGLSAPALSYLGEKQKPRFFPTPCSICHQPLTYFLNFGLLHEKCNKIST